MRMSFGDTFTKVHETLAKHNHPLESLKKHFLNCYQYLQAQISECNTIEEFFNIVQRKCNLTDISVLKGVVEHTGIPEVKAHVDSYQQAIDTFCKEIHVQFSFEESFLASRPLNGETIEVTVDWDKDEDWEHTLNDVKLLLSAAFGRLSIHVQLVFIKPKNSIVIICSFPIHLTGLLIAEAISNLKLLKKQGLLKLTIGYCTIWNHSDEVNKNKMIKLQ